MDHNNNELNQKQQEEALMAENQKTADAPAFLGKLSNSKFGKKVLIGAGLAAIATSFAIPRINGFDSKDNTKIATFLGPLTLVAHKVDTATTKLIKDIHDKVSGPNVVQEHYQENTSAEQKKFDTQNPGYVDYRYDQERPEVDALLSLIKEQGNTDRAMQLIKDGQDNQERPEAGSLADIVNDSCYKIASQARRITSIPFRGKQKLSPDMREDIMYEMSEYANDYKLEDHAERKNPTVADMMIRKLSFEYKDMGVEGRSASKLTGEQIIDHGLAIKLCAEVADQHIETALTELQEMTPGELVVTKLSHDGDISYPAYEVGYKNEAAAQKEIELNGERAELFSQGARALDALYSQRGSMSSDDFNTAFFENTAHYENKLNGINDQSIELQEKHGRRYNHLHDTVGISINSQKILDEELGLNESIEKNEPEIAQVIDKSHEMEL